MIDQSQEPVRIPNVLEDPSIKAIARVYAESYLSSKGELSGDDRVAEFRSLIEDVLTPNPAFERRLISPMISVEEKTGLLDRVITPVASPLFANFLKVVAEHGRMDLLRIIFDVCVEEQQRRSGRVPVKVRTAAEISDDKLSQIRESLAQKLSAQPEIEVIVEPELLGGLIIQVGDTVYDSSLKNRLGQLRSRLRQRYVHEIQSGRDRFSHSEGN